MGKAEIDIKKELQDRPKIGISRCLLGDSVRYNGGHKLDHYLKDRLGKYVDFVPICPEVEVGMGIPREAVQLFEINGEVKMLGQKTKTDFTKNIETWSEKKILQIKDLSLSGFILKSKSPSCGVYRTRLYREDKPPSLNSRGLFARELIREIPQLLIEEEGRLNDNVIRDNFIERVFINHRWIKFKEDPTINSFIVFHECLKYTLMSHDQKIKKKLGQIVANTTKDSFLVDLDKYYLLLTECLGNYADKKSHRNVLEHIVGYFKKDITKDEKVEIKTLISNYSNGYIPLIVPITILNHFTRKYSKEYLKKQFYLNPHSLELLLRNQI